MSCARWRFQNSKKAVCCWHRCSHMVARTRITSMTACETDPNFKMSPSVWWSWRKLRKVHDCRTMWADVTSGLYTCCRDYCLPWALLLLDDFRLTTLYNFSLVSSEQFILVARRWAKAHWLCWNVLKETLKFKPLRAAACVQKSIEMHSVIITCIVVHWEWQIRHSRWTRSTNENNRDFW